MKFVSGCFLGMFVGGCFGEKQVGTVGENIATQQELQQQQESIQSQKQPTNRQFLLQKQQTVEHKTQQIQAQSQIQQPFYCGKKLSPTNPKREPKPLPPNLSLQHRQTLTTTVYGIDMFVDSVDITVSRYIINNGYWQPGYINLIGHIVKSGDNVLNLGSQSGLQAVVMGKIIGPTGKLFIFQPYSFSNSLVTKNIQLNGLSGITKIYKNGASDSRSTGWIEVSYGNTGGSSIFPAEKSLPVKGKRNGHIINHKQEVILDRADTLLPSDIILDFVLVDVQKMQIKALRGLKAIIERSPNLVIMTQWLYKYNPDANKQQGKQFFNFMIERGYRIFSYVDAGGKTQNVLKCTVGQFKQYKDVEELFGLNNCDLFLFPKGHPLISKK